MSSRFPASAARALPDRPNLEHLKNQARRRLRELRDASPACKLADAQIQIARDYGFSSWREMKAVIDGGGGGGGGRGRFWNLTGFYRHDPRIAANGVVAVTAEGGRLFLGDMAGGKLELSQAGEGRFAIAGVGGGYSFEGAEDGPANALVHHGSRGDARLERIGAEQAQALRDAREQALADQRRPRAPVSLDPEVLQRYVGHYVSPLGPGLDVICRDGRLLAQVVGQPQVEVFAESETRFFYRITPAQLEFVVEGGRADAAILHQNGMLQRLDRVSAEEALRAASTIRERQAEQQRPRAPAKIDPAVLDTFAGRYRLDADRTLTVSAEDGRLFVDLTDQPRFEVFPESDRSFFWTVVAAQISFETGADGRVTHAVLHQAGRDFPLARLEGQGAAT